MSRKLFASALVALMTVSLGIWLPVNLTVALLIVLLLLLITMIILRKIEIIRRITPLVFISLVFISYYIFNLYLNIIPITKLDGMQANITGVIVEEPEASDEYVNYIVETNSIDVENAPQKIKLQLKSYDGIGAKAYDQLTAKVKFNSIKSSGVKYLYADKIYINAYITGDAIVTPVYKKPLYNKAIELRQYIRNIIYETISYNEASVLIGITLGDISDIPNEINENIISTGVSHVMAVSGMHLAILCQLLLVIFKKLQLNRRLAALILILVVVIIMAVTGFSSSILRSGISYLIMLAGMLIFRKPDALNSLGAAVIIMLIINPFAAVDLAFLLSACATFGIIVLSPKIYNSIISKICLNGFARRIISAAWLIISQTTAATIATLPITIVCFKSVSIVSLLTNILINYAVLIALVTTILGILFLSVPFLSFVGFPMFILSGLCAKYIIICVNILGSFKLSVFNAGNGFIILWVAACLTLIGFTILISGKKFRISSIAILSSFMLVVSSLSYTYFNKDITQVGIIDVGQGTAVCISRGEKSVLIGCGKDRYSSYKILSYLRNNNLKDIDLIVLPSTEENYAGGTMHVVKQMNPSNIVMPCDGEYNKALSLLDKGKASIAQIENVNINIWDNIEITSIKADKNGYGNPLYIKIGHTTFLVCTPSLDLNSIPTRYQKTDMIISSTAVPSGIKAAGEQKIIISGDYSPAIAAVYNIATQGTEAYITAGYGNITAKTRGNGDIELKRDAQK